MKLGRPFDDDRTLPGYEGRKPGIEEAVESRRHRNTVAGCIGLVLGNHDPQTTSGRVRPEFGGLFHEVHSLLRIKVPVNGEPHLIVLCHYALRVWDRAHYGAWHLFVHSHGGLADDPHARSWDAGVDHNGYAPMSFDEVAAVVARKTFRALDHHRGGER